MGGAAGNPRWPRGRSVVPRMRMSRHIPSFTSGFKGSMAQAPKMSCGGVVNVPFRISKTTAEPTSLRSEVPVVLVFLGNPSVLRHIYMLLTRWVPRNRRFSLRAPRR